jgi:anti-anti-sigma factor
VIEKGEVFDSTLLKNMINSLIAEGKRNFAIDLTPLDYIYSDAINVILALNRRILDVSGRLSLMGPCAEVRQILERTGIQNILKIFDTETELLKSSEDIILQTTRYNLSDLQTYQQAPPPKPKSEFEDLRSEISTAMPPAVGAPEPEIDRGYRQPPQQFAPPQPPPPAYKEEEFEAAYKSFETEASQDRFAPPPPQAPQYAEPFTPPPVQPPRPAQPPRRPERDFAPVQEPAPAVRRREPEFEAPVLEPLTPPETRSMEEEMAARKEPAKAKARPSGGEKHVGAYEEFGRDTGEPEPRKRSPVPILITILVVALLAVGAYFGYTYFMAQRETPAPVPEVSKPATPPPAVAPAPAPAPAPVAKPQPAPAPAPVAVEEPAEKPSKKPGAKTTGKKPAAEVSKKTAPAAEAAPAGTAGKIFITSTPPGATIKADDSPIGTTPFTWKNPNVIGEVTIVLSKPGYKDAAKTIEFTGGSKTESFKMEKEEAPPSAKPAAKPAPAAEPEAEAAPPPPPPPPKPAPAPEAAAPAPAAAAGGDAGTVFIASIPPVADVYMDGKLIGKTNITKLNVTAGSHSMRFVKGTQEVTKDMSFKGGDNPSQLVNLK